MIKNIRQNSIVRKILIYKRAWRWFKYYLFSSGVFADKNDINTFQAKLRKDAHAVEKGLSLPQVRPLFGRTKIIRLLDDLELAREYSALDEASMLAESVIQSYLDWHQQHGHCDSFLVDVALRLNKPGELCGDGGVINYSCSITPEMRQQYDSMVLTRRSVRHFSSKEVPFLDLEDAIRVACSSPSVCNRQPWAVSITQGDVNVARLLRWQAGNRGFEKSINTLLVVMADMKSFVEDYEIFEPFVDAGIFAGGLVNALHSRNISSCVLNLCVSHEVAEKVIKELGVPEHMFPVMMVACGYAHDECKVAISKRGPAVIFSKNDSSQNS